MMKQFRYPLCALCTALASYALLMGGARWALWPHAAILRFVYGIRFQYVEGLGYLAPAANFVIAKGCMGAKLFCAAFLILALGFAPDGQPFARRAARFALTYVGCALGALGVSVARIALSLPFTAHPQGQLIHTLLSLFVYFGCLLALYLCAGALKRRKRHA